MHGFSYLLHMIQNKSSARKNSILLLPCHSAPSTLLSRDRAETPCVPTGSALLGRHVREIIG